MDISFGGVIANLRVWISHFFPVSTGKSYFYIDISKWSDLCVLAEKDVKWYRYSTSDLQSVWQ
jgi:hypothetical protein